MAVLLGPFNIGFPVAFEPGGDTTRDAFDKHIHEIEKIYGILNALDNGKVSSYDLDKLGNDLDKSLQDHIASTNPHPKWKISFDDLTGELDGSKLKGRIEASLVYGLLSNAYIEAGHVNGLEALVKSLIPDGGSGDGITDMKSEENGYIKFANGFIVQWGKDTPEGSGARTVTFPISFSSKCLNVQCTTHITENTVNPRGFPIVLEVSEGSHTTKSAFKYSLYFGEGQSYSGKTGLGVYYTAYGI